LVTKDEDYSSNRKGKRQYLDDAETGEFTKRLNVYFRTKVNIPRIMRGEKQELETLINEEALLFVKFLRNETKEWKPRTAILN